MTFAAAAALIIRTNESFSFLREYKKIKQGIHLSSTQQWYT